MRAKLTTILATLVIIMLLQPSLQAIGKYQDHPKDGNFKRMPSAQDHWYFFDNQRWYIKAPDKFQHMMGSFALTEISSRVVDDYLAAGMVFGIGLYKEYDDGMREGWSPRDLLMNTFGIAASLVNNEKYKFWMDWADNAIILKFSLSFR